MPTALSMLDCLKVYRVFIGTRCSIRCVAIRTIYADNVEHARLFESISSVQRYSLQRSMRAHMRSAPCARFIIMCAKRQAVHVRAWAQHLCTALVPTIDLHFVDAAFVHSTCFQCSGLRISRHRTVIRTIQTDTVEHARLFKGRHIYTCT